MGWMEMRYVAASVALIGAIVLACCGREGWGWLIFAAIMVGS